VGEAADSVKYGKLPHPLTPSRKGRGDFKVTATGDVKDLEQVCCEKIRVSYIVVIIIINSTT